uniref:Endonuclease exonuclease phosphatase domain containing protein n=1 Tax=Haemonchus contortus TaxID=6289 RepID=A0A7I4XZB5_HAECO
MTLLNPPILDRDLIVCTYNCQSVDSADRLSALIHETQLIEYHVIGLSETKRREPLSCTWNDGTLVYLGARETNSPSGGVGFIVSPGFSMYVQSVEFHGHRLATLTARLTGGLVTIIQAYAPTATSSKEEHDTFYKNSWSSRTERASLL